MPKKLATGKKELSYVFIEPKGEVGRALYERLYSILDTFHKELSNHNCKIALAWSCNWKPDADGRLRLGECKKASELDRQLHDFDFVILLNEGFWKDDHTTEAQRAAVMDHELMHCAIAEDSETGKPKVDETGRTIFRIRGHDIEEFSDIVDRHGFYKRDVEAFYNTSRRVVVRNTGVWVAYTKVRETLALAGIQVSLEDVAAWSEAERRDVLIWAELRVPDKPGEQVNALLAPSMPACLAAVVRPDQSAGETRH